MAQSTFNGDLVITGSLSCNGFNPPNNSVSNSTIATPSPASAGIAATKVIHYLHRTYTSPVGSAVASGTGLIHLVYGSSCTIVGVQVSTPTPPTGGDTVVIDVKKGNSSTAYASVLSSTITLNSSTTARAAVSGTLATTSASAGDTFEVVVTATGTSCQGLIVTLILNETAF